MTTWMNTVLLGFSENVYEAALNDTAAGTISGELINTNLPCITKFTVLLYTW